MGGWRVSGGRGWRLGRGSGHIQNLAVAVSGDLSPGSVVSVDVSCTVGLNDVVLAGFPGSRTVSGHGIEYVDVVRGGA